MTNNEYLDFYLGASHKERTIMYRLTRSRRGISTIIGAAFFITIMLLAFNLMLWQMVQYDSYQQGLDKMAQRDKDRLAERLEVTDIFFTASGTPLITITARNTGGISINLVRIYFTSPLTIVEKGSGSHYFTGGFLSVGESGTIDIYKTGSTPLTPTGTYTLTFVTERGNVFTSYYPKSSKFQSSMAYTFGSMKMRYDWWPTAPAYITYAAFRALPWQNASIPSSHLSQNPSDRPNWLIKIIDNRRNYFAWQVRILFRNIAEVPIYLGNSSNIFLMTPFWITYGGVGGRQWPVGVCGGLNISQSRVTSDISVPYEQAGTTTQAGSEIVTGSALSYMGVRLKLAAGDYAYLVFTVNQYRCTFTEEEPVDKYTPFTFAGTAALSSPIEYKGTSNFYCGAILLDGFQVRRYP